MCFKTASLYAPSQEKATVTNIEDELAGDFSLVVQATDTREVKLSVNNSGAEEVSDEVFTYATPQGLRNLATALNELADKLEA